MLLPVQARAATVRYDAPMKRWKIAISLALVAAVCVPALSGTWRLAPGKWVDLTSSQKQRISNLIDRTNNCTQFSGESEYEESTCRIIREQLANGGTYYPPERVTPKYLTNLFFLSAGAFGVMFVLVMVVPSVGRRYWLWLRQ
jgi:hypothetical protein